MICSFATRLIESITSRSAHAAANPSFKFECLAKPNSRGQAGRQTDRQTKGLSRNRLYIEFILVLVSGDSSRVNWRDVTHLAISNQTLFSSEITPSKRCTPHSLPSRPSHRPPTPPRPLFPSPPFLLAPHPRHRADLDPCSPSATKSLLPFVSFSQLAVLQN